MLGSALFLLKNLTCLLSYFYLHSSGYGCGNTISMPLQLVLLIEAFDIITQHAALPFN
jgi:hypothetical protein